MLTHLPAGFFRKPESALKSSWHGVCQWHKCPGSGRYWGKHLLAQSVRTPVQDPSKPSTHSQQDRCSVFGGGKPQSWWVEPALLGEPLCPAAQDQAPPWVTAFVAEFVWGPEAHQLMGFASEHQRAGWWKLWRRQDRRSIWSAGSSWGPCRDAQGPTFVRLFYRRSVPAPEDRNHNEEVIKQSLEK